MIEFINVSKAYGQHIAVNNCSFTLKNGEVLGFLGRNGAGKSTVMNMLTGYLPMTCGQILVDGLSIEKNPLEAKKKIGYLPEQPPLYLEMTAREYLAFVCGIKGIKGKNLVQLETEKNARITQIADVLDRPIRNLSKGYRQRVGIAQALTGSPRYVVLDEPTVGLDPMQIVDIRNLIRDLRKSCTVLLSSHILSEISEVCDRVIIIHKGIILAEDTVSNLIGQIGRNNKLYVRIRGREDSLLALLRNIPGVAGVESQGVQEPGSIDFLIECQKGSDLRENIARTLLQADVPLLTLKSLNETLEDVFMNVINEKKEV